MNQKVFLKMIFQKIWSEMETHAFTKSKVKNYIFILYVEFLRPSCGT